MVAKLTGYAATRQGHTALLIADQLTEEFDFAQVTEGIKALLPQGVLAETFIRGTLPDTQVKTDLRTALNQGPLLVNYAGHGSVELWRGDILTSTDAATLANGYKLPLVVAMTCLNGLFQDVYTESLAEALILAPQGGAVAVWASSGLTDPEPQSVMNREFMHLLFNGGYLTVGQAVMRAKAATTGPDVRKTWILFGDPTTRLKQ